MATFAAILFFGSLLWIVGQLFRSRKPESKVSAKKHALIAAIVAGSSLAFVGLSMTPEDRDRILVDRAQKKQESQKFYAQKRCKDTDMAFIMSQKFVSKSLKAPSTAKYDYKPLAAQHVGDCAMRIKAYVDAQNGFGAMIRTEYVIDMEYLPDENKWRGSNLTMQDR